MKKEYENAADFEESYWQEQLEYYESLSEHKLKANLVYELHRFNNNYELAHDSIFDFWQKYFDEKLEEGDIKLKK